MTRQLRAMFEAELASASRAVEVRNDELAFHHLARAHILSQRSTLRHVRVHWRMLKLGRATSNWREVIGQSTRIIAAALFSRIWVPIGNTGRANVSALKRMPIPDDLRAVLEHDGAR